MTKQDHKIRQQVYIACEKAGMGPEFLSLLGSWGDSLSDEELFKYLEAYNKYGTCMVRIY